MKRTLGWTGGFCVAMVGFAEAMFSGPVGADPLARPIAADEIQPVCQEDDTGFVVAKGGCARIRGHIAASDSPERIGGRKAPLAPAQPWVLRMGSVAPVDDPASLDRDFLPPRRDTLVR